MFFKYSNLSCNYKKNYNQDKWSMKSLSKLYFLVGCFAISTAFLKAYESAKELQYLIFTASTSLFFLKISLLMPSKLLKLNSVAVSRPSALLSYTLSCFLNPDYFKKSKKSLRFECLTSQNARAFIKCSIQRYKYLSISDFIKCCQFLIQNLSLH